MISREEYLKFTKDTHEERIAWFREARFGMFIHYGLFSQEGMGEWVLVQQNMDEKTNEEFAKSFSPKENCVEEWVKLAYESGAKYCVMTTRHHEGFSLWNSKVNPYNSYNYCGRDLVREFVVACRKYNLRIGLYSSIMDWHHPDGWKCATDEESRKRFVKYIEDLNTELLSNYGKIDILWYDMPWPLDHSDKWDSVNRNYKMRQLQPGLLINNRSKMPEDFFTPEESLNPENTDADWEACMTFNRISWGYIDEKQAEAYNYTSQQIIRILVTCTKNRGNLLLNIGPSGDGSIPSNDKEQILKVGKWLKENGEAIYGLKNKSVSVGGNNVTAAVSTVDCKTVYLFNYIWPSNGKLVIGGYANAPTSVKYVKNNQSIDFEYEDGRIILKNLPEKSIDDIMGIAVIKMEFPEPFKYYYGYHYPQVHGGIPYDIK